MLTFERSELKMDAEDDLNYLSCIDLQRFELIGNGNGASELNSFCDCAIRNGVEQAREAIPTEPAIWITASKLEEAQGKPHMVDKIIETAISSMRQFQVSLFVST